MARKITFTRADYEQLPEDWRAELIEGDLVMIPAPDPSHERLAAKLIFQLYSCLGADADKRVLGSPDIHIDDRSIIQPDALVLPEGTQPTERPWKIPAPIWVAEIFSPSTKHRDRGVKLRLYARRGVQEAWLLDPDEKLIEVHDLEDGGHTVHRDRARSRVLPELAVDVAAFFAL